MRRVSVCQVIPCREYVGLDVGEIDARRSVEPASNLLDYRQGLLGVEDASSVKPSVPLDAQLSRRRVEAVTWILSALPASQPRDVSVGD